MGEYVVSKMATDQAEAHAAQMVTAAPAEQATAAGSAAPAVQNDEKAAAKDAKDAKDAAKDAKEEAKDEYISTFYSNYYTIVNLLSFLLQALIVARLLTRLGIRRSLFIMPLVALGGWFALALFVNVTMVRVTKAAENSLDYSLHNTLRQALFLPTSREAKYKAKAAIDTFFFRMGDVIAGLGVVFLFVEVLGLGVRAFAMLNVVLAGCWLLLAWRAGRLHDELVAKRGQDGEPASSAAG
jgi:ATP:ADP antiporter, AAA family